MKTLKQRKTKSNIEGKSKRMSGRSHKKKEESKPLLSNEKNGIKDDNKKTRNK
jgi:hypothetical protein